jgi:hypothetical protein
MPVNFIEDGFLANIRIGYRLSLCYWPERVLCCAGEGLVLDRILCRSSVLRVPMVLGMSVGALR